VTAVLAEPTIDHQVAVRGRPPDGFPTVPNTTARVDGRQVLWLGPDEWLVVGGHEDDFGDADAAIDVSANRVCLELTGPGADDVLAQGCSLDLHPSAFAEGACAQTLLARVQVILCRREAGTWQIFVRRSFVPYVRAWLADALKAERA
jgi:sarcosine oxidase subunit gamma